MNWIKNLKIKDKLNIMVVLSLFFVVIVGVVGYFHIKRANNDVKTLYSQNLVAIKDLSTVKANMYLNNSDMLQLINSTSNFEKSKLLKDIKANSKENTEALKEYDSLVKTDDAKVLSSKLSDVRATYKTQRKYAMSLISAGNTQVARGYYYTTLKKSLDEYITAVNNLIKYNTTASEEINIKNIQEAQQSNLVIILTLIISFAIQIPLSVMISKMITQPITQAVESLEDGAGQVKDAANSLAESSSALATGTEEQASAIQETSASIEETDSMVKQNTENTEEAAKLAKSTKDFASSSNEKMNKMLISMEELKKSSDEIGKIIKVIDEIAFQTNILALNAAVEAARAGDAGKGFAVVAEEVRNLAQKSAIATRDTAKIIESNIGISNQNVDMTREVSENIKEVDEHARKMSDLLNEIAGASEEQSKGIDQINKAIQQMEQVLQSNANSAEESAAASNELSSQAESVKEIVDSLKFMV